MEQTKKQMDINFTYIVQLSEVIGRFIDVTEGNPYLKKMLKKEFKGLLNQSRKLDKVFRGYIKQMNADDPEESFDLDCDFLFDLLIEVGRFKTDEQYIKAISTLKLIK